MPRHQSLAPWIAVSAMALGMTTLPCQGQTRQPDARWRMRAYLEARVAQWPNDASAWRLLGKDRLAAGNYQGALWPFKRAVELGPENAAARFGLAECLLALNKTQQAADEFDLVVQIAPASQYAQQARWHLSKLPQPKVVQASYEIKRFDGSRFTEDLVEDQIDALTEPARRWSMQLELGALYNSNVALTPTSRGFSDVTQASAQAIFNPYIEYRMFENDFWTIGNTFNGYFTLNEDEAFGALNLQSYQPGMYVEQYHAAAASILVSRAQYDYTLDEFDGTTFGNRHAGTVSLTSLWDNGDTSVIYWTTDFRNFTDDGATPATSSRDGWTHTLGLSHVWDVDNFWATTITLGGDLQWADVEGTDFRYFGGSVYLGSERKITESISLHLEGGLGYRDYYDSNLTPSRDEVTWRASTKLEKQWTPWMSTAAVFNFDAFDSKNESFATERFLGGVIMSLKY